MDNRSLQPDVDEASAILRLFATADWATVAAYLSRRLELARRDLESLSTDALPGLLSRAQGRCEELRTLLTLTERAEKVLESRTRR